MRTIRCPECREWFEGSDHVVMDKMNNLNHKSCSDAHPLFIKDEGSYEEITNKYIFFEEIRIH